MATNVSISSYAESQALAAESLVAFSGLNLLHVKRGVAEILGLIGRHGIFDEFTLHDISHIDSMLKIIDWLIPEASKKALTPTDWLMIVLGIYFHDIGLLVTKEEFELREESSFTQFRHELFSGTYGIDYRARVSSLGPGDEDRFLYQEFVRQNHAERSRSWVMGSSSNQLGASTSAVSAISSLLNPLDRQFRRDLGLICASHHLDDLYDLQKYKPRRAYGSSNLEMCNVQYCAIVLRATDLLHITRDRTPSIVFKLINPSDPISQQEWAKQQAVRRVAPLPVSPGEEDARDSIEVHAFFSEPTGFFGLTSYLRYAQAELEKCHQWASLARSREQVIVDFPWRRVDDRAIEAENFLPQAFAFQLDQKRILDLLVGHTLYNDTNVVIRELVQNALDAVRLQQMVHRDRHNIPTSGEVKIFWDSVTKSLVIEDNGIGMTQEVIERHFLNVGVSLYQEEKFKKNYPAFAPISRFGIGILSTFMVSDDVEVFTVHADDGWARQLSLRSVHGRYLIRLIDKASPEVAKSLGPHGTRVIVKLRPSAELDNVLASVKKWVRFPGNNLIVSVYIDRHEPVAIGHHSPSDYLQRMLHDHKLNEPTDAKIEIREKKNGPLSLAFGVKYSHSLNIWSFWESAASHESYSCIAVEGIFVEDGTPGFGVNVIESAGNISGRGSPKTTVARDGFEHTKELEDVLRSIFSVFVSHVHEQLNALIEAGQPVSAAVPIARSVATPIVNSKPRGHLQTQAKRMALETLELLVVEINAVRKPISIQGSRKYSELWTSISNVGTWAESVICAARGDLSLSQLAQIPVLGPPLKPPGPLLCVRRKLTYFEIQALSERQLGKIIVDKNSCRIDMQWIGSSATGKWLVWDDIRLIVTDFFYNVDDDRGHRGRGSIRLDLGDTQFVGLGGDLGVSVWGLLLLNPVSPIVKYMSGIAKVYSETRTKSSYDALYYAFVSLDACLRNRSRSRKIGETISHAIDELANRSRIDKWSPDEMASFLRAAEITDWNVYQLSTHDE
ncbi:HD domain-containing protein [Limnoglobus roseus]|uniref:Molecular chaperone HtpG n=1 Tax=Limnoglobus roseus TaxID=2598579 RepID=A0A5C1ACT3_9BACT|nr:ATP-binding protein [Limnoglobus roseus]QEL14858.1 molecular chaperone HtpG [Limnoglobus roseus]